MLFFVKADKKKLYTMKLPISAGDQQVKTPLEKEPITFQPANTDDKDQLVAFSHAEGVTVMNLASKKHAEIEEKDVTVISWSHDNGFLFLGTKEGKVGQYKVDL